jgi:quercetin 2,3-dioxygenase
VNLPAALKMSSPRYQEVKAAEIPSVEKDGATVRVVAGEVFGVQGPVTEIAAQPLYMEIQLAPGAEFVQEVPFGHMVVAYVFAGQGRFGYGDTGAGESVSAVKLVRFGEGDQVRVKTESDSSLRFMLMAGAPFKEPIMPYGPFVMNTKEEIQQALLDLRNGTFVS